MRLLVVALCAGALLTLAAAPALVAGAQGQPPWVVAPTPAKDATGVAPNATVRIVFSTTMDRTSVVSAFRYTDGVGAFTFRDGLVFWSSTGVSDDTFTFDPNLNFASGSRIGVTINGSVARDIAGGHLDGDRDGTGGDDYRFNFTVADDPTPPRVASVAPANGATSVSVSAWITVGFTKAMNRTATEAALAYADGVASFGASNGTVRWSGVSVPDDRMEFNPDENLRAGATITVRFNGSVARDRGGALLDGNGNGAADGTPADDYAWSFTVEAADGTPPTVRSTDPSSSAAGVPLVSPIAVTFSERMNRSTVEAGFSYTDGAQSFGSANGSTAWSLGDEAFTFTPAKAFAYGTRYTVTLDATLEDEAGNRLDGNGNGMPGDAYVFAFTTVAPPDVMPPAIVSTDPADGETRVSRTPVIAILFSEPMNRASVQAGIGLTGGVTPTDFGWPNNNSVTFSPSAALAYNTSYTVIVFSSAKDLAGNGLAPAASFSFRTTPWTGPVTGTVLDGEGVPVGRATVTLGPRTLQTDANGAFVFEAVEEGTYALTIAKLGYDTVSLVISVGEAAHDLGVLRIQESTVQPGFLPWAVVAGVVAAAATLVFLLRRRPRAGDEPARHWRPAEAVVIPPEEQRPKPKP